MTNAQATFADPRRASTAIGTAIGLRGQMVRLSHSCGLSFAKRQEPDPPPLGKAQGRQARRGIRQRSCCIFQFSSQSQFDLSSPFVGGQVPFAHVIGVWARSQRSLKLLGAVLVIASCGEGVFCDVGHGLDPVRPVLDCPPPMTDHSKIYVARKRKIAILAKNVRAA